MTNEEAARLNAQAQNCGGMGMQAAQQWGLYPQPCPSTESISSIRGRLQARADELKRQIAAVDAYKAELAEVERMLTIGKVEP